MDFSSRDEFAEWMIETFTKGTIQPKPPKVNDEWNVKKGDLNLLVNKSSDGRVYLSYVSEIKEDGESYEEWYQNLGYAYRQANNYVDRMNKIHLRRRRGWRRPIESIGWDRYIEYEREEYLSSMVQRKNGMRCSSLFNNYYVFPFNKQTAQFFLNWNIDPFGSAK